MPGRRAAADEDMAFTLMMTAGQADFRPTDKVPLLPADRRRNEAP